MTLKEYLESNEATKGKALEDLTDAQKNETLAGYIQHGLSEVEKLKTSGATKEQLDALKSDIQSDLEENSVDQIATLKRSLDLVNRKLEAINTNANDAFAEKRHKGVDEILKQVHEAQKANKHAKFIISKRDWERATKALVDTGDVSNSTLAVRDNRVNLVGHRRLTLYDSLPKQTIPASMGGSWRYIDVDSATLVRGAAATAEGNTLPASTITFQEYVRSLELVGDFIDYTAQFNYDYNYLMDAIRRTLIQNMLLDVDDELVNGNGTSPQFNGLLNSVPNYVPAASGITDANIFDLIAVMKNDIESAAGSKYQVNRLYMNTADMVGINMMLKKDADNDYIPVKERIQEMGIMVLESNSIAANTLVIGDSNYAEILESDTITIETGLNGTNFAELKESMRAYTSKNLLIKEQNADGWLECTDIATALTTLES